MSKVVAIMSMSLDGYVADLNDGVADGRVRLAPSQPLLQQPAPGNTDRVEQHRLSTCC
jgi:hypothetical protein